MTRTGLQAMRLVCTWGPAHFYRSGRLSSRDDSTLNISIEQGRSWRTYSRFLAVDGNSLAIGRGAEWPQCLQTGRGTLPFQCQMRYCVSVLQKASGAMRLDQLAGASTIHWKYLSALRLLHQLRIRFPASGLFQASLDRLCI